MKLHKYTIEQLEKAVKTSTNIRQVLQKLKIAAYGGNYEIFKKAVNYFNIDTSHFLGKSSNKNRYFGPKRPIEKYLDNTFPMQSNKLRKRLINEGIFIHQCSNCLGTIWCNKPIPLELDHIDGNNKNNNLSNLRLLCNNCHALTENYRGKNKKNKTGQEKS